MTQNLALRKVFLIACAVGLAIAFSNAAAMNRQERSDEMLLFPEEEQFSFTRLFGSKQVAATLISPDTIEAFRIKSGDPGEKGPGHILGYRVISGPVTMGEQAQSKFATLMSAQSSFTSRPACAAVYRTILRFTKGKRVVDVFVCFSCQQIGVTPNDRKRTDTTFSGREAREQVTIGMSENFAREALSMVKTAFPKDKLLPEK